MDDNLITMLITRILAGALAATALIIVVAPLIEYALERWKRKKTKTCCNSQTKHCDKHTQKPLPEDGWEEIK